jgi:hypothetical protein
MNRGFVIGLWLTIIELFLILVEHIFIATESLVWKGLNTYQMAGRSWGKRGSEARGTRRGAFGGGILLGRGNFHSEIAAAGNFGLSVIEAPLRYYRTNTEYSESSSNIIW